MRKQILLIITMAALISCAPSIRIPYTRYHSYINYAEYAAKGFFITESNSVNFDYVPMGSITAVVESGWLVLNQTTHITTSDDAVYGKSTKTKTQYGNYVEAQLKDAIEEIYSASKAIGADGVINLSINSSQGGYVVSGMIIKRK